MPREHGGPSPEEMGIKPEEIKTDEKINSRDIQYNIEKELEESGALRNPSDKKDKKLTFNEAMVYQKYAVAKEGVGFSEQAKEESYKEAEMLVNKLREANFEWLDINWDEIDFRNTRNMADLEERLSIAAGLVLENEENATDVDKQESRLSRVFNKKNLKGTVLPLVLSVGILLSGAAKTFAKSENYKNSYNKNAKRIELVDKKIKDSGIEYESNWGGTAIKEKILELLSRVSGEEKKIKKVVIKANNDLYDIKENGIAGTEIDTPEYEAEFIIEVAMDDGKTYEGYGIDWHKSDYYVPGVSDAAEIILKGLRKIPGFEGTKQNRIVDENKLFTQDKAFNMALRDLINNLNQNKTSNEIIIN